MAEYLETAVSLSLQVALLVIITHAAARLARSDAIRGRLWSACHLLMIALTLRGFLLPRPRLIQPWADISPSAAVELALFERQAGWILFALWAAGAAVSALLVLLGCWQVRRFLKTCRPIQPIQPIGGPDPSDSLDDSSGGRRPEFLTSGLLGSPFCWQIHRPVVVLPEFLLDFEPGERRLIVRHELEHLRNGHPLALLFQRTVEVLFWFHPLVWWSSRQAELAREFACDEAAVRSREEVADYLRSLLKIVEHAETDETEKPSHAVDLAFVRGRGVIAQRAARLAAKAHHGFGTVRAEKGRRGSGWRTSALAVIFGSSALAVSFVWLPVDVLKSPRSAWSAWPAWSASALHAVGVPARDYDVYDNRSQLYELLEDRRPASSE